MPDKTNAHQIMTQIMGVLEKMSQNPNTNLTAENFDATLNKLITTVLAGYERVGRYCQSSNITQTSNAPVVKSVTKELPRPTEEAVEKLVAERMTGTFTEPVEVETATPETAEVAAEVIELDTPMVEAPMVEAQSAPEERDADDHAADEFIAEHGSAIAAVAFMNAPENKKRGRKAKWVNVVEEKAADEFIAEHGSAMAAMEVINAPENEDVIPKSKWVSIVEEKAIAEEEALENRTDEEIANDYIAEHGSARAALEFMNAPENRKRGRKSKWEKIVLERAHDEIMRAPELASQVDAEIEAMASTGIAPSAPTSGYKFAHLSRQPFAGMDPEEAVRYDKIVCLIDGKERTMLSRHLKRKYGMTREEYIAHFNLRPDYPLTAEGYSGEKSRLAKEQGLGRKDTPATVTHVKPAKQVATNRKKRLKAQAA